MEAFKAMQALATGGQSTIDDFAKNVYIKNNLTNKLENTIRDIKREFLKFSESSDCDTLQQFENNEFIITDITIRCIDQFLIIIESIILHGLKEKLSFSKVSSKVLSPVRFGYNTPNRFSSKNVTPPSNSPDFWPVVLILNHNQVNLSLKNLNNILTDVGRCRAWIRLSLNDGLLSSYLRALTNDTSLLHGFYRPSAYLRDKEHMDRFLSLIDSLTNVRFDLNYDYKSLNNWNSESLVLSGFNTAETEQDASALEPVLPAIDALKLLKENDENETNSLNATNKSLNLNFSESNSTANNNPSFQFRSGWSTSPPEQEKCTNDLNIDSMLKTISNKNVLENDSQSTSTNDLNNDAITSSKFLSDDKSSMINTQKIHRSISNKSTTKSIKIKNTSHANIQSYDSLLQSYSDETNLCSTPEIRDIYMPTTSTDLINKKLKDSVTKKSSHDQLSGDKMKLVQNNYEIIPQSIVLDNSDESTQRFLSKFFKIQSEIGLDKQDYKCNKCSRPIGMVYGKSRLCRYDGLHYCLDCNQEDKAIIPARVIHNWDFIRYTISRENKDKLDLVENEPLINIKLTNPLLYQFNATMKECLQLRTQLFYLHAYLFTCQESIALDLRKQVWPSEHLFEHIHLYSLNDLLQAQNGTLFTNLRKSIILAKKHVVSCVLCSQKGFICEICSSSKIIYPFDVDTTFRCENCKACFHMNCIILNNQQTSIECNLNTSNSGLKKTKQRPCPRCLRIQCREKIQKIRMT